MSEEQTDTETGECPAGSALLAKKNPSHKAANKKKLIAIIAGAVVASLLLGGGVVYWLTRDGGGHQSEASAPAEDAEAAGDEGEADPSADYIEVPPMMVNLRGGGAQAKFVKLRFVVVAAHGKADAVKARLPEVLDALQPFLRELRPDDLSGASAVFRIKEEMMRRSTEALGKNMVRDILIQDLIQQ